MATCETYRPELELSGELIKPENLCIYIHGFCTGKDGGAGLFPDIAALTPNNLHCMVDLNRPVTDDTKEVLSLSEQALLIASTIEELATKYPQQPISINAHSIGSLVLAYLPEKFFKVISSVSFFAPAYSDGPRLALLNKVGEESTAYDMKFDKSKFRLTPAFLDMLRAISCQQTFERLVDMLTENQIQLEVFLDPTDSYCLGCLNSMRARGISVKDIDGAGHQFSNDFRQKLLSQILCESTN